MKTNRQQEEYPNLYPNSYPNSEEHEEPGLTVCLSGQLNGLYTTYAVYHPVRTNHVRPNMRNLNSEQSDPDVRLYGRLTDGYGATQSKGATNI